MIVNRIIGDEFKLVADETVGVYVLFVEVTVESRATINKTDTSGNIRSKTAKWISRCQSDKSAAREIRFCGKTKPLDACTKVPAPEIFYIGTATPRIISGE